MLGAEYSEEAIVADRSGSEQDLAPFAGGQHAPSSDNACIRQSTRFLLSTIPLKLGTIWNPTRPGVVLKPITGAPKPAETAEQRLIQMRELAKGFTAEMELDFKTKHTLRLLSKPLARYGKTGAGVLDGVLLSYVLTTDPEVYLLIEARDGKDGPGWQYAFAPEASAPLRCSWKGSPVWDFPADSRNFDPTEPYCVRGFAP